jgi:hypothetical protein
MFPGDYMTIREQILFAIQLYCRGEYETATFCDVIGGLYYFEPSGYRYFQGEEKALLDQLLAITERFSPYGDDFIKYPNVYHTEEDVKNKTMEVAKKLNLL